MTVFAIQNSSITSLDDVVIPEGTTKLNLSRCTNLTTLPLLPETIKDLDLSECTNLGSLPNLPNSLESLNLSWHKDLETLPPLPKTIKDLNICGCKNLRSLPNLPNFLKKLNISGCRKLTTLPTLPETIEDLNLSQCENLESLPNLPNFLKKLNISGCRKLTTLPTLPDAIEDLNPYGCTNLESLLNLPKFLKRLDLFWCENLTTLPPLPETINYLSLSKCTSLPNTPALVAQLEELEQRNANNPSFRLTWPEHIDRSSSVTEVKSLITQAYREYHESNPYLREREPSPADQLHYPTFYLLHRFMTESAAVRGGVPKIVNSILPTVRAIAANPDLLEFTDESSKEYLKACVNRPVTGFTEISAIIRIASQPDIKSKLEAARMIQCVYLIAEKVKETKVGPLVEVELANAMIREVHQNLLQEKVIEDPWPGIPEGVAYEGAVRSHLTTENISAISNSVKKLLKDPLEEVANFLCNHHLDHLWASLVIPKQERQEIIEKGKQRLEELQCQFNDKFESNPEAVSDEEGLKLMKNIEEQEKENRDAIVTLSKERTFAAVIPTPVIERGSVSTLTGEGVSGVSR